VLTLICLTLLPDDGVLEFRRTGMSDPDLVSPFERSLDQMSKLDDLFKNLRSEKNRKATESRQKQQRKKITTWSRTKQASTMPVFALAQVLRRKQHLSRDPSRRS